MKSFPLAEDWVGNLSLAKCVLARSSPTSVRLDVVRLCVEVQGWVGKSDQSRVVSGLLMLWSSVDAVFVLYENTRRDNVHVRAVGAMSESGASRSKSGWNNNPVSEQIFFSIQYFETTCMFCSIRLSNRALSEYNPRLRARPCPMLLAQEFYLQSISKETRWEE